MKSSRKTPQIKNLGFPDVSHPLLVARGSMGIIYRVRDNATGEIRALKVLTDKMMKNRYIVRSLKHEYEIMKKFNHRNVIRSDRWLETKTRMGFLMDYVDGIEFKILLHEKKLDFVDRFLIVRGVVDALHYLHTIDPENWIIHCDLKPENVLVQLDEKGIVESRSSVKLVDYGTSMVVPTQPKLFTGTKIKEFFTRQRVVGGSYLYMSPEQTEAGQLDPRSDIYSLGCFMYEAFSGQLPFKSSLMEVRKGASVGIDEVTLDREELAHMHRHDEPEDPRAYNPHLQSELVDIIFKCMEKDPSKRFQSVYAVSMELAKIKCYRGEKLVQDGEAEAVFQLRVPILIALKGKLKGQRFALNKDGIVLGRSVNRPNLVMPTEDSLVSGQHCRFVRGEENVIIEDLGSRNGSYVNGKWVKKQILKPGDKIRVGKNVFRFEFETIEKDKK